jgi:hypothetical protein
MWQVRLGKYWAGDRKYTLGSDTNCGVEQVRRLPSINDDRLVDEQARESRSYEQRFQFRGSDAWSDRRLYKELP